MPPPTPSDSWQAARRFGIVIDAGSSGSRLQIYSWKDPYIILQEKGQDVWNSLPKVEKGVRQGDDWTTKVEPGLSSFADNLEGIASYLAPLLQHARSQIPPSLEADTPLFLLATAGMRLLNTEQQTSILEAACHFLKFHSRFRLDEPSLDGPCGASVRIITGEEEGLFGWISVNYLLDGFTGDSHDKTTYGFLDMGGASTQIAFEPSDTDGIPDDLIDVRLRLLGGKEINHRVFVTTWLGYGTNQARERYVGETIRQYEQNRLILDVSEAGTESLITPDPCLPKNLELVDTVVADEESSFPSSHRLVGTGSFTQCLQQTSPLLNKTAPCPDTPCLFNGIHVPAIDFSASHFIGVSEYWYSSEDVFGLGGVYDFVQYERAANAYCARDWEGIVRQYETSQKEGMQGDDDNIVDDEAGGQWGEKVTLARLQMQCFKAAWVTNVLHEGIGIPRIVDAGGNATVGGGGDEISQQAENKGLGRPVFQSLDAVGDIAISWTLGKMVLEASKEVPPARQAEYSTIDAPTEITRPPFVDLDAIEDHLSAHLPSSLSKESLGFSPITSIFYMTILCAIFFVIFRVRQRLHINLRRVFMHPFKRDDDFSEQAYSMEEGANYSPPSTFCFAPSILRFVRRLPFLRSRLNSQKPLTLMRRTPSHYQNGFAYSSSNLNSQRMSRPSSPSPPFHDDMTISNSTTSLASGGARSRNASQMNLSTLVPRQTPLSRVNSASQCLSGNQIQDDS